MKCHLCDGNVEDECLDNTVRVEFSIGVSDIKVVRFFCDKHIPTETKAIKLINQFMELKDYS